MADLTKHVMINKWDDDINNAIQEVGGDTYGSEGLPDYADIIKTQLISNTAIDDKVYQNFLYVDEDKQTSNYPWDGEPTSSKNAVQSSVVADSLNQLYQTMATTERFNVLLVDEIPTKEINLSAVYLLRSKCCDDPECCCNKENTYSGCYFIKTGKKLKRIDIPEFKINLDELFFLTRAEYDSSLSEYLSTIEDLLKKKFGQYWKDENFNLYDAIEDLKSKLKVETDSLIEKINTDISNIRTELIGYGVDINSIKSNLNTQSSDINGIKANLIGYGVDINSIKSNLNTQSSDINGIRTELMGHETDINSIKSNLNVQGSNINDIRTNLIGYGADINSIKSNLNTQSSDIDNIEDELLDCVKLSNLKSLDEEIKKLQ